MIKYSNYFLFRYIFSNNTQEKDYLEEFMINFLN